MGFSHRSSCYKYSKDPLKIIVFALGSFAGSYLGSILEEKIALGYHMFTIIIDKQYGKEITDALREAKFQVTSMKAIDEDSEKYVVMVFSKRKNKEQLATIIQKLIPMHSLLQKKQPLSLGNHKAS